MRIGLNPNKGQLISENYFHQVVIPVYIPNLDGYFEKSLEVLQLSLNSLFQTVHNKTFITVVNNGSCVEVKDYLDELLRQNKIQEVIHSTNIGKLNAVLKGIVGHKFQLITICDSDVLFLNGWQEETNRIFLSMPKVGVVGIVPQFNMYKSNSGNVLIDNLFNRKLKFLPVKNSEALIKFYDSIGWDRNYNQNYLKYTLGIEWNNNLNVLVGAGHFVATYKGNVFEEIISSISFKMGEKAMSFLDGISLKYDYWRVTTYDNYAYHMGNTLENWMLEVKFDNIQNTSSYIEFKTRSKSNKLKVRIKNRLLYKLLKIRFIKQQFYKLKQLPNSANSDF